MIQEEGYLTLSDYLDLIDLIVGTYVKSLKAPPLDWLINKL